MAIHIKNDIKCDDMNKDMMLLVNRVFFVNNNYPVWKKLIMNS